MSDDISIIVEHLSKCYQIYENPIDRFKQMLFGRFKRFYREFWAVRDVSFQIKKGEAVGIVGQNGSGKSTLLQMICGTLNPTYGKLKINGSVSALLELGSGFNPEFTGKENVYLNASVLGLSKAEIDERYDEILAFSEIGDFINQPVKTYSSGMVLRLAFSVAINVKPDILVVDEALAVGDELFQRKCFARIESMKDNGLTLLFVSHSSYQVTALCDRAILMDKGEVISINLAKSIINFYQKLIYAPDQEKNNVRNEILKTTNKNYQYTFNNLEDKSFAFDPQLIPKSSLSYHQDGAEITAFKIQNSNGKQVNMLTPGQKYELVYEVEFKRDFSQVRFGMLIKTSTGVELGGATSCKSLAGSPISVAEGSIVRVTYEFKNILNVGLYFINLGVSSFEEEEIKHLHRILDAMCFRVGDDESSYATGMIDFSCKPKKIELIENC